MAVEQKLIPLESREEWREALKGIKHTFGHSWENCYAMHLTTGLKTYLYSFEADDIRTICPFTEREFEGYIDIVKPYGFSGFVGNGRHPDFVRSWGEFVRDRGYVCGYLGLNPLFDYSNNFHADEIHQYGIVYILDLTPDAEDLLANMSRNRRRQLKKDWGTIRSNFVLEKSVLEKFFIEHYHDFLRKKNASPVYFFSKETLSYLFRLDNVILVGTHTAGKVTAVSVFSYTADAGEYLFNVSLPEGRENSAALVWYGINYLKSRHISSLNLGGGSTGEFKRRFGSKVLPLRCLIEIYRQDIYDMLCHRMNVDPRNTGFFPAYRITDFKMQTQIVKTA